MEAGCIIVLNPNVLFAVSGCYITDSRYMEIITTVLAIIATVAFFMEPKSNERINEAQLIIELNDLVVQEKELLV